jgi:hypothetical protein
MSVRAREATAASGPLARGPLGRGPLGRLARLRGRSLDEVVVRCRQELAKIGERVLSTAGRELSDEAFLHAIGPGFRRETAEATAAAVLERLRAASDDEWTLGTATFFTSVGQTREIAAEMERRYPEARRELLVRAERAVDGEFALLGLESVSFGWPIDWRLEPLSGKRTPLEHWSGIDYLDPDVAGDKKVTWELNRHGHFVTFGQAYTLTREERYAEAFAEQMTSWLDENPPSLGINWASSLEVSFRAISWLWALHLTAPSRALSPQLALRALKSLVAHGRHVETYLSHYFSPNTHLTGEALGLLYLGTALPELGDAARWRAEGARIMTEQAASQVRPDGVYFEQTTYYHRYTADFYLHAVALARATGAPVAPEVESAARSLADHLAWITEPHGVTPLLGDDDGGRLVSFVRREPRDMRDTLAAASALFGVAEWRAVAGEAPESLWLLGPEAHANYLALEPTEPAGRARAFGDGGYYVMRDGWAPDDAYALVDCGPHGALSCGHAHADALSLVFSADGVSWLVDPGTFTYTGDPVLRDVFRTTEAHNTVTVDGVPQSEPSGPFAWRSAATAERAAFVSAPGLSYFEGSHDGYARLADPVTHSRAVLFVERDRELGASPYVVVRDALGASGRHAYSLRYRFSPRATATVSDGAVVARDASGAHLAIAAVSDGARSVPRVAEATVSEAYARRAPAPLAAFDFVGVGSQQIVSVAVPTAANARGVCPEVARVEAGDALVVDFGEARDVVLPGGSKGVRACERLRATGDLAWARVARGRVARAALANGTLLYLDGGFTLETPAARFVSIAFDGRRVALTTEGCDELELRLVAGADVVIVDGHMLLGASAGERLRFVRRATAWTRVGSARRGI